MGREGSTGEDRGGGSEDVPFFLRGGGAAKGEEELSIERMKQKLRESLRKSGAVDALTVGSSSRSSRSSDGSSNGSGGDDSDSKS